MTELERCQSCQWFDETDGTCDHCAYGHPFYDYNGLKPEEVKKCDIYVHDESKKYEWQWTYFDNDRFVITDDFYSRPKSLNWKKFDESKRLKEIK